MLGFTPEANSLLPRSVVDPDPSSVAWWWLQVTKEVLGNIQPESNQSHDQIQNLHPLGPTQNINPIIPKTKLQRKENESDSHVTARSK